MASEDVIELGSSEDETEPPAPKKIKPLPNAMVHIPRKLHGVTIKPLCSNFPVKHKGLSGKSLAVTKMPNSIPHFITNPYRNKPNGRPLPKCLQKPVYRKFMTEKPIPVQDKLSINPINVVGRGPVVINRTSLTAKAVKHHFKAQGPKVLNNLPPSITIKRTQGSSIPKVGALSLSVIKKLATCPSTLTCKKDLHLGSNVGDVLTVELDDDEGSQSSTATASPQWYLKPEEHFDGCSLEVQNNKEPDPLNMIEITIDDSPVKTCLVKRVCNEHNELSITIEDSPIKPLHEVTSVCDSDSEQDKTKVPLSKKKLNYPIENESNVKELNKMEIDSNPAIYNKSESGSVENTSENKNQQISQINKQDTTMEADCIEKKPLADSIEKDNSVKNDRESQEVEVDVHNKDHETNNESSSEFHPIYQRFIDLCFELENSDDMQKIVEKKIKTYYRQVSKDYVESEEFLDMVSTKISLMKAGPEKMFLYIKDIVDELNLQRKMAKSQSLISCKKSMEDTESHVLEEDSKYDHKRRRQIRKLEKTIKKLHRAIQKLEEQEVDFDDEEDSVYLLTERYKERLIRVHAKFCQITNTKMPSEPHIQIECRLGQPPGPARRLEKWVNRKVPIGIPLPFPDFHDVLKCVREANEEDRLGWNEVDIMEEARDLFTRCGKKLQRRRQENEWRLAASRLTQDVDPAEENESLKYKLDENKTVAAKKVTELFNKYADKQSQLKLEAVEIGDKEAEESPMESEDDEVNDNSNSLENRQKRKDRLRRLLQEKSKKNSNEKESQSSGEVNKDSDTVSLSSQNNTNNIESSNDQETSAVDKTNTIDIKEITKEIIETDDLNTFKLESHTNNNEFDVTTKVDAKNELQKTDIYEENFAAKTIDYLNNDKKNTKNEAVDIESIKKIDTTSVPFVLKPESKLYDSERINLISDDSDADELNLLQKLHSGNEVSSPESSDYDSPIAISDTLESNSDSENEEKNDVISIENSSYSESETAKDDFSLSNIEEKNTPFDVDGGICNLVDESQNVDILYSPLEAGKEYPKDSNEDNDDSEKILLASSDDEDSSKKNTDLIKCGSNYINLKDDAISISETFVDEDNNEKFNKNVNESGCEKLLKINLSDVHIHSQEDVSESQNYVDNDTTLEAMDYIETIPKEDIALKTMKPVTSVETVPSDCIQNNFPNTLEHAKSDDVILSNLSEPDDLAHCKNSKLIDTDNRTKSVETMLDEMFNMGD